jgi:DNA-binding NarL/FixJ family response regulator
MVDDSPIVIESVRYALEPEGVEVFELAELTDAERARALDDFDLILLDIQMPAGFDDDIATALRLRSQRAAPIVLLSSLPEVELAERARAAGLDGYILKDRGVDNVALEIRAWLDRQPRPAPGP